MRKVCNGIFIKIEEIDGGIYYSIKCDRSQRKQFNDYFVFIEYSKTPPDSYFDDTEREVIMFKNIEWINLSNPQP